MRSHADNGSDHVDARTTDDPPEELPGAPGKRS
jgi:hypothetical protein